MIQDFFLLIPQMARSEIMMREVYLTATFVMTEEKFILAVLNEKKISDERENRKERNVLGKSDKKHAAKHATDR